jgi:DnaJ-domain-containing protein 1
MSDQFARLNEARRPWLDADRLKQTFHTLSATIHPDKIPSADESAKAMASKQFAELNAAYQCLSDPKSRLLHLLELERGEKPKDIQQIPTGLADWFVEVARACRETDGFLAEKGRTSSPLLLVQFFQRGQDWIKRLNTLQKELNNLGDRVTNELKSLDEQWMGANPEARRDLLPKLEELYRLFGYLNRWNGQIQERITRIAF